MRRAVALSALVGLLAAAVVGPAGASAAASAGEVWTASLSGASEVPAVATTGTASATFVLSPDGSTIDYAITYSGLTGTLSAAHIHLGAAGANGGVMLPLAAGPSPMVGTLTAADLVATGGVTTFAGAVAAIRTGGAYVNFHTAANPAGEIRGQIGVATGAQGFIATLDGAEEVPPVSGSQAGRGVVVIDAAGDRVDVWVTYSGLSSAPSAGHIHLGAVGANGGILFPLSGVGTSPVLDSLTATDLTPTGGVTTFAGALDAIRAGNTYLNFHTAAHPAGEIRGQVGVVVAAPAPSPTPTPAPTAAPSASPTVTLPPTSTADPSSGPAGGSPVGSIVVLLAVGVLAGAVARAATRAAGRSPRKPLP